MANNSGTPDLLKSADVRNAITHLAEVNGLSGYEKGWMPRKQTDPNAAAEDRGHSLFVANLAMTVFAVVVVSGRIYTRAFVAGGLGGDDYAMVAAAVRILKRTGRSFWDGG